VVVPAAITGVQPRCQRTPCGGSGDGVPRHRILEPRQPGRVGAPAREQAVALGHRVVVCGDLPRMGGFQRPGKAVEEATPARGALLEQPVHLRGEPDGGDAIGEVGLGTDRVAVEAEDAAVGCRLGVGPRCRCRRRRVASRSGPPRPRGASPPSPRRPSSLIRAPRSPRPGPSNEIASSRLVFPAPFSPAMATIGAAK
jgi:hypothetical protein